VNRGADLEGFDRQTKKMYSDPLFPVSEEEIGRLRRHEKTGRPLGSDGFVGKLGTALGRILQRQKPGRKRGPNQK
jgi:hypothetical protein